MEVTVDYCTECGYREEAVEAAEILLEEFEGSIDSLNMVPSTGGVFRISVDGQVIFDMEETRFSRDKIVEAASDSLEE